MNGILTAFFTSLITTLLIIRSNHFHSRFTSDADFASPQKFHKTIAPRIGGIAIIIGLFLAILLRFRDPTEFSFAITLLICALPTFAIGLTEDLTKKISVRQRLFFSAISSLLVIHCLQAQVTKIGIPILDLLFTLPLVSTLFTIFALTGLANAYNIIDGFHGLSSMVGILTLVAIGYISLIVGDPIILYLSLILVGSILGFFIWNYPRGLIFLGDGGAYLIGFWIAALSILLVNRHPEISPWFALLINGYPILETIFTIYRRKIYQGKSPGKPDVIHFHTLIYRRILMNSRQDKNWFSANSRTAPFLWILAALSITPAVLWWRSTPILVAASAAFVVFYVWLYTSLVKFRTPKWLHLER